MLQRTVAAPVTTPELARPARRRGRRPAWPIAWTTCAGAASWAGGPNWRRSASLSGVGAPLRPALRLRPRGVGKSVLLRGSPAPPAPLMAQEEGGGGGAGRGARWRPSPGRLSGCPPAGPGTAPGRPDAPAGIEALDWPRRPLLLIDTYEALAPLDPWLREVLLPRLPQGALVVIAGRTAPPAAWRADPAWSEPGRYLPLRNLRPGRAGPTCGRGASPAQHAAGWTLPTATPWPSPWWPTSSRRTAPGRLPDGGQRGGSARAGIPSAPWTPPTWCARSWSGSWSASPATPPAGPRGLRPRPGDHGGPPGRGVLGAGEARRRLRLAAGPLVRRAGAGGALPARPGPGGAGGRPALARPGRVTAPCTARWPGTSCAGCGQRGRAQQRAYLDLMFLTGTGTQPALYDWGSMGTPTPR